MEKSDKLERAVWFATKAHDGQFRSGERRVPYIIHPLEVTKMLKRAGVTDEDVLSAAVLHDTMEDCQVSYITISTTFGKHVADMVYELTNDPSLTRGEAKDAQVAKALVMSSGARLVKIADKTHNLMDLLVNPPGWHAKRQQEYVVHATRVVGALMTGGGFPDQAVANKLFFGFMNAARSAVDPELAGY